MSSSSKDVPCCTSTNTSSSEPTFSIRWAAPCAMSIASPGRQPLLGAVEGDDRGAGHDEPVLGPVGVALVAEPPAGLDHHAA